jgi:hypothetical protein
MIRRAADRGSASSDRTSRASPITRRPNAGLVRVVRLGVSVTALVAAFILGAVLLHVAGGDQRGPIELAAVPDVSAAQGTGEGFHEVAGRRVDPLERTAGIPSATDVPSDDGATGTGTGPSSSSAPTSSLGPLPGAGGASTTVPARPGSPTTIPGGPMPTLTTPTVTVPGVTVPGVSLPPVSLPPVTLPPVSLPPPSLPPITTPTISVPTLDPSIPTVSLPPVTLPPFVLPWREGT